jgi:hypothetical protein
LLRSLLLDDEVKQTGEKVERNQGNKVDAEEQLEEQESQVMRIGKRKPSALLPRLEGLKEAGRSGRRESASQSKVRYFTITEQVQPSRGNGSVPASPSPDGSLGKVQYQSTCRPSTK